MITTAARAEHRNSYWDFLVDFSSHGLHDSPCLRTFTERHFCRDNRPCKTSEGRAASSLGKMFNQSQRKGTEWPFSQMLTDIMQLEGQQSFTTFKVAFYF